MRLIPLGSGSQGNATLAEIGGRRVLVDAGLSSKALVARLESVGVAPSTVEAIVLSHEHQDHSRGAERFSRRFGVPVYGSLETLEAMDRSPVHFAEWRAIEAGVPIDLGSLRIDPFPVPHDAVRPVGFVLGRDDGIRAAIVTDLGHVTTLVAQRVRGCEVLMVESNHDDAMLRDGPYPWQLKQRVGSRLGHLSNHEAAALVREAVDDRCRAVVLLHLSEKNNTPELARSVISTTLERAGRRAVDVRVAATRRPSRPVEI